ncbi:cyclin-dependent kinase regulatory subunit [Lentinula guzmanii]|uniref:Cyclin-dependent kinases regulatory subunit n=2 Tax=Lentinula TaxID=5352 RepID=A0AA38JC24_9AGAR|nr:cyclin-dependent kinase regulatory subunit [Lentinula guzmanii]KAJ3786904.1 cyclin-dependent kinase regulatory subunit [Lentinula aff. detonsa]KAJ3794967.1 cyclin-dependent kinase regulatory subunit [Lentinula aff. detonsa]
MSAVLESSEENSKRQAEQKKLEEILEKINYSDRYTDDIFEYRHVILPKQLLKYIPEEFWDQQTGALRLLEDEEWRSLGIKQSLGWEHYEVHVPEPHVLLFRRPKDYVPPTLSTLRAKEARRK